MRFLGYVALLPIALLVSTACGSADEPAVAKPKKIANQADCVKYLSADEVREVTQSKSATAHRAIAPGDCSFDLADEGDVDGGLVQLVFGENHVVPQGATAPPFEGNAALEQRTSPGAHAQQCRYAVLLNAAGGPNSSMLVTVLSFTNKKDVCSVAHEITRIVFAKLPPG